MLNLPKAFNTGLSVDPDIRFSLGVEHTGHGDRTSILQCAKKGRNGRTTSTFASGKHILT